MTVTSHLAREFKYLRILFMRKLRQQNEERAELKGKAFDYSDDPNLHLWSSSLGNYWKKAVNTSGQNEFPLWCFSALEDTVKRWNIWRDLWVNPLFLHVDRSLLRWHLVRMPPASWVPPTVGGPRIYIQNPLERLYISSSQETLLDYPGLTGKFFKGEGHLEHQTSIVFSFHGQQHKQIEQYCSMCKQQY